MSGQTSKFSHLDEIVKDSFLYLRLNYRILLLPSSLTCAALVLFSIARDFLWSYFHSAIAPHLFSQVYLIRAFDYAFNGLHGLGYLLIFPLMLLVVRHILLGNAVSLEVLGNQPKQRIINSLVAFLKILIPLQLINFTFNSSLSALANELINHLSAGNAKISIVLNELNDWYPLPYWAYENINYRVRYIYNALSILSWGMLLLTWYIATKWSMVPIFAALDKEHSFKASTGFTKGYVGLIFIAVSFVTTVWAILAGVLVFADPYYFFIDIGSYHTFTQDSPLRYMLYLLPLNYYIPMVLTWLMTSVILSKVYLLIEAKGKQ